MGKPSDIPEWASVANTDDISGQPNVVEPPTSKKQRGFDFREKPPRNWLNWLLKTIYLWINWLNAVYDSRVKLLPSSSARALKAERHVTLLPSGAEARGTNAAFSSGGATTNLWLFDNDGGGHVNFPIQLRLDETLKRVRIYVQIPSGTATMTVYKKNLVTSGITSLGTATTTGTALEPLTVTLTEKAVIGFIYYAVITATTSGGGDLCVVHGGNYTTDSVSDEEYYDISTDSWAMGAFDTTIMTVLYPIPVVVGETIEGFAARVLDNATEPVTALIRRQADGVLTQVGGTATSNLSGTVQTISHTLASPHTVLDGNSYFLEVQLSGPSNRVYLGKVTTTLENL